jgi:ATP-dependent RNA helicase RhlE
VRHLIAEIQHDPITLQVGTLKPTSTVAHALYPVAAHLKTPLLLDLLKHTDTGSVLVFTKTKHRAKRVGEQLVKLGHKAASLQGNLSQNRRQEALDGFRSGTYTVLVATDIAARGIDVDALSHVINFDVPPTPDDYIHRVGRTARADATGEAFLFVSPQEEGDLRGIERAIGKRLPRVTVPGFDYAKKPAEKLEVPLAERLAGMRAQRASAGARPRGAAPRRGRAQGTHAPQGPHARRGAHPPRGRKRGFAR